MKTAQFFVKSDTSVQCRLCPHNCVIAEGRKGLCLARSLKNGRLISDNYGLVTSLSLDPVEKKPFKMYEPGKKVLSAGTFGCNLKCRFCQNHRISQNIADSRFISPETLVSHALQLKSEGNIGLAFTYNEPLIWYEYVLETSLLAKNSSLKTMLVSNGFINSEPFKKLIQYIDAINIDLKAFSGSFYTDICSGSIDPVKTSIKTAAKSCHLEVTTLIVPGYNDSPEEMGSLSAFIASVSANIPLHISRFHPDYMMSGTPHTPVNTILSLRDIAKNYLKNVFCGNI